MKNQNTSPKKLAYHASMEGIEGLGIDRGNSLICIQINLILNTLIYNQSKTI